MPALLRPRLGSESCHWLSGASAVAAVAAVCAQVIDLASGVGIWDETLAWTLGGVAIACACAAPASSRRTADIRVRRAWGLWVGGALLLTLGAAVAGGLVLATGSAPHWVYLPWLGFAVCAIAGLGLRSSRAHLAFPLFVLDALPLVIATVALIRPNGAKVEWQGFSGEVTALAFPALYVLLALVASEVALLERRGFDSVGIAATGFAVMAIATVIWVSPTDGGFAEGAWADALWTVGALVVAGSAWRPALRGEREAPVLIDSDSGARAFLPLAGVAVLGILLLEEYGRFHALVWATIASVVILAARFVVSRRAADLALGRERTLRLEVEETRALLATQNDKLRELDQLKDGLIATVSHELRTPLTAIGGYVDIVAAEEAGPLTDEQHRMLAIVRRNTDRLQRIVEDLLLVAQSDAGKLTVERTDIDLADVTADALATAHPAADAKNIRLQFNRQAAPAYADPGRMAQVISNLISNAIKFTPDGGTITISTEQRDGAALVDVADTGMGMTPGELQRLFERFYRTEAATTKAIPGTGLGLSIVKMIIDAHEGTVDVESQSGVGTTFRIALPSSPTSP